MYYERNTFSPFLLDSQTTFHSPFLHQTTVLTLKIHYKISSLFSNSNPLKQHLLPSTPPLHLKRDILHSNIFSISTLNPNDFNFGLDKSGLLLSFWLSGMQLGCVNGMGSPSVACCEASSKYFDVFWGFVAIGCVSNKGKGAMSESESSFSCTAMGFIWKSSDKGMIKDGGRSSMGAEGWLGLDGGSGWDCCSAIGDSSSFAGSFGWEGDSSGLDGSAVEGKRVLLGECSKLSALFTAWILSSYSETV